MTELGDGGVGDDAEGRSLIIVGSGGGRKS